MANAHRGCKSAAFSAGLFFTPSDFCNRSAIYKHAIQRARAIRQTCRPKTEIGFTRSHLLFTLSVEDFVVAAIFVLGPALIVWVGRAKAQARHAAVFAGLALFFAAIGVGAFAMIEPGQGMGGLVFFLPAIVALALAVAMLSAAVSIVIAVVARSTEPGGSNIDKYQHKPLLDNYWQWKGHVGRPHASYQDFLEDAHHRYFPVSAASLVIGAIALVVVFALILHG